MKIRTLNQDSSGSSCFEEICTKEAQEENILNKYNNALKHQFSNQSTEALRIFKSILKVDIPLMESKGPLSKTLINLKYSCYLNAANLSVSTNCRDQALEFYDKASEIDNTDVTLWYKMGSTAIDLQLYRKAINYFLEGLKHNENHWLCLDKLIILLYATDDWISCLININKGLQMNKNYGRGLVLRRMIREINPYSESICKQICSDYINDDFINKFEENELENKLRMECNEFRQKVNNFELLPYKCDYKCNEIFSDFIELKNTSWINLGETLISIHKKISENKLHHFVKIDLKKLFSILEFDDSAMNVDEKISEIDVEEINLQYDTDCENDEQNIKKKKSIFKKRRSDVLFLQPWFWHTSRKKSSSKRFDRFSTIEEALESLIYSELLCDNELEELSSDDDKPEIFSNSQKVTISNPYFRINKKNQIEDLQLFYTELKEKYSKGIDIIELMEEYLNKLITFSTKKWPQILLNVYSECFKLFKNHYSMNDMLENVNENYYEMMLAYLEINIPKDVSLWTLNRLQYILYIKNNSNLLLRMYWFMAIFYTNRAEIDNAINNLHMTLQLIEDNSENINDFSLELLNAHENYSTVITSKIVENMIRNLDALKQVTNLEKLYYEQQFPEIIETIKNSFNCNHWKSVSNMVDKNRINRPIQLLMFLDALWLEDNIEDCCKWTEVCLNEITNNLLLNSNKMNFSERQRNQKILEKCILTLLRVIENGHLEKTKLIRLTSNLSNLLRKEYNQTYYQQNQSNLLTSTNFHDTGFLKLTSSADIWILLYYLLKEYEQNFSNSEVNTQENDENDDEKLIPNSLIILFVAHDFLGRRSKCLENNGHLLSFALNTVEKYLNNVTSGKIRNKIEPFIEQILFCMYEYPSKKNKTSRHLADHNTESLQLTWQRCEQIIHFLSPRVLPEFDSYRVDSISNDSEILFKRILDVIPHDFAIAQEEVFEKIRKFIENNYETKLEIPKSVENYPHSIRHLYYLLGDYYLKNNDLNRAINYLMYDLTINPSRFDTWAELALAKNSQIEIKLNNLIDETVWKSELEFFEEAYSAKVCYKQALKLVRNHATLLIEFGSFAYTAQSFCSRFLKRDAQDLSMDRFSILETNKNYYLKTVQKCFIRANNTCNDSSECSNDEHDERWLFQYMFGKVSEKQREHILTVLEYYAIAAQLLDKKNASYPSKINYNDPQNLSIEALEILYRMSASVLKMFHSKLGMIQKDDELKLFQYLRTQLNYFQKNNLNTTIITEPTLKNIIDLAIECLEECCLRFPRNYKSIYRLAHFYYHFNSSNSSLICYDYKSLDKCYQLLFTQYKSKAGNTITGLFTERKKTHFFNGVYRIPTSEVDRPGNFAHHMERCLQLSIQLLRKKHNYDALVDISIYLNQKPDLDKVYLTEKDRLQICDMAFNMAAQCIKTKISIIYGKIKKSQAITFLLDIHRLYEKISKNLPQKEPCFLELFLSSYKIFRTQSSNILPIPSSNKELLESALKCCRQLNIAKKAQLLQKQLTKSNQNNDKTQQKTASLSNSNVGSVQNTSSSQQIQKPITLSKSPILHKKLKVTHESIIGNKQEKSSTDNVIHLE